MAPAWSPMPTSRAATARSYTTKIQIVPNSVIASGGGFTAREFFEIEDAAERQPAPVDFGI